MLVNMHFLKSFRVTISDYDETIYTKLTRDLEMISKIRNS